MTDKAIFAAGCFWHIQILFHKTAGVTTTNVGYTGGHQENPTYRQVCHGDTGHAEAVLVEYDPNEISYQQLLQIFWDCHDPTTMNRQGPDIGSQYRSAIFYTNEEQQQLATASKEEISAKHSNPIVTEIVVATEFYPAEDYHQFYILKRKGEM